MKQLHPDFTLCQAQVLRSLVLQLNIGRITARVDNKVILHWLPLCRRRNKLQVNMVVNILVHYFSVVLYACNGISPLDVVFFHLSRLTGLHDHIGVGAHQIDVYPVITGSIVLPCRVCLNLLAATPLVQPVFFLIRKHCLLFDVGIVAKPVASQLDV